MLSPTIYQFRGVIDQRLIAACSELIHMPRER